MTKTELKPCPFCGGEKQENNRVPMDAGNSIYWIFCENCHTCGPIADTKRAAIAAWNRRVTEEK